MKKVKYATNDIPSSNPKVIPMDINERNFNCNNKDKNLNTSSYIPNEYHNKSVAKLDMVNFLQIGQPTRDAATIVRETEIDRFLLTSANFQRNFPIPADTRHLNKKYNF